MLKLKFAFTELWWKQKYLKTATGKSKKKEKKQIPRKVTTYFFLKTNLFDLSHL